VQGTRTDRDGALAARTLKVKTWGESMMQGVARVQEEYTSIRRFSGAAGCMSVITLRAQVSPVLESFWIFLLSIEITKSPPLDNKEKKGSQLTPL